MMPKTLESVSAVAQALVFVMKDPYTRILKSQTSSQAGSSLLLTGSCHGRRRQAANGRRERALGGFLSHCDEELVDTLFGVFAENRH